MDLGERFEIERELGHGGMGTVLLAHDKRLSRRVAVKVLSPDVSARIGALRFAREIRVTARLVHPNIVPLFDSGAHDDRLFFVMPFMDGPTLRVHMASHGVLATDESIILVRDLAEAMAYAHAEGVIHRDIKPENIFSYRDRAILADFGIAKLVDVGEQTLSTTIGEIMGTLAYMSPEQGTGEEIDARSDLYALGCVWYEMLAGVPPYRANSPMALLAQHVNAPVPDLRTVTKVSSRIAELVSAMLAKDAGDRPANAADVLDRLRHAQHAVPRASVPVDVNPVASAYKPESVAAYNEGRSWWSRGMQGGAGAREKLDMAKMYFERARTLDARNPLPLVGLADALHVMGYRGFAEFEPSVHASRALRLEALAMGGDVAELHSSIGVGMLYWEDDFEGAGRELKRSRELDPGVSTVRRFWGTWLKIAGRIDEGVEEMRAAVDLAPDVAAQHNALGDILIAAGRYDEAIPHLRTALRLNPRYDVALERLEIACHRGGRSEEAFRVRRTALAQRDLTERIERLEENVARFGWAAARELDIRSELTSFMERAASENPFEDHGSSRQLADQIITCYAELGERKAAMDWIEHGFHKRPGRLRRVLTDFPFDRRALATDPRYAPLLRNAGLDDLLEENVSGALNTLVLDRGTLTP